MLLRLLTLAVLTGTSALPAQEPLSDTTRLRIVVPSLRPQRWTGQFVSLDADSLRIRSDHVLRAFSLGDISRVERRTGTRTRRLAFATAGLLLGVGIGVTTGELGWDNGTGCGPYDVFGCQDEGFAKLLLGVAGGVVGTTVGYNFGRRPRDVWAAVPSEVWRRRSLK